MPTNRRILDRTLRSTGSGRRVEADVSGVTVEATSGGRDLAVTSDLRGRVGLAPESQATPSIVAEGEWEY